MTQRPVRSIAVLGLLSFSLALGWGMPQGAQQSPMGNQLPEDDPTPFEFVPPPPTLLSGHTGLTEANSIVITGQALQAREVMVQTPGLKTPLFVNPAPGFSIEVPLAADQLNQIVLTSLSFTNTASAPTVAAVIQDSSPPELTEINQPLDGTSTTAATVAVSGRVGDALAGMEDMVVTVSNGSKTFRTNLTAGSVTTGTFLATGVTLDAIDTPTTITATATDSQGHFTVSAPITVTRVAVPASTPELEITSPTGSLSGEVGMELAQALTVHVTTDGSTPFEGKVVTIEVVAGGGLLADTPMGVGASTIGVITDSNGDASAHWTLGSEPGSGNQCVLVSSVGVSGGGTFCAIALSGTSDTQINITQGNDQLGEVGSIAALPLRVRLSNNGGPVGPLDGGEVTFDVVSGGGSFVGNPDPVDVLTDASGHAEVNFQYGATQGLNRVEVTIKNPPPTSSPVAVFNLEGFVRDTAQGTSLTGLVLDNADEPIQGATVELSDNGLLLASTTSDLSGRFTLAGIAQGGAFDLDVDGASATFVGGPDGSSVAIGSYPALHFEVIVVTGVSNEQPSPIYLPFLDPVNARQFDNTKDVILTVAGVEGLEMLVRAGSMTNPDGSTPSMGNATTISLNQVQFDKVAMPFPDGADNRIAWTLQPAGATFAPPIEVRVPNVAGLAPGTLGHILSFDHDVVAFVATATAGVTNGGEVLETDPDAGIDVSGWGGFCPPFHAFFDLSIASVTPGMEIPVTTELPVPGGVVRSDDCGHGRFGAPRGTDLHAGIDLVGTAGVTDVVSVYDGTVIAVESGCTTSVMCTDAEFACGGGYGNFVVVEHTTTDVPAATVTFYTAYAHLDSVDMSIMEGSLVTAGSTPLGKLGQSGNANPDCFPGCTITPFVHFEISPVIPPLNGFGAVTDPEPYLSMLSLPYPAPVSQTPTTRTLDGNYAASFVLRGLGRTGIPVGEAPPGSLFEVNNVPLTDPDQVTLQGTWLVGESLEQSYASDFMAITGAATHTTVTVPSLARTSGQPETLDLTSGTAVLDTTMGAMMTQLSAKIEDQSGMTTDVTTGLGTVYTSSNEAILEVTTSGLAKVPAGGSIGGTAILSASNEGISSTVSVDVIVSGSLTTVYGFITRGGVLTSGVTVTALPGNGSATTTAGLLPTPLGQFKIENVPADQGPLTLIAELDDMGTLVAGVGTSVIPVPGGNTDAGIIEINDAKVWIGGTGDWEEPTNWSPTGVPTMSDFAIIDVGGGEEVTVNDVREVAGLTCEESLVIASGGSLEVLTPFQVNNAFELDGGTLLNCTVMPGSGGQGLVIQPGDGTLNASELVADAMVMDGASLTVTGGLALEGVLSTTGTCGIIFDGTQLLSGSGEIALGTVDPALGTINSSGGTLTVDDGILIHGGKTQFFGTIENRGLIHAETQEAGVQWLFFFGTVVNRGVMRAKTTNLYMRPANLTNYGEVYAEGSSFEGPTDSWLNLGTVHSSGGGIFMGGVTNEGVVTLAGGNLHIGGTVPLINWTNRNGVIRGTSGFTLEGNFTLADMGIFEPLSGNVRMRGQLELEGGTLLLDRSNVTWRVEDGASIRNGRILGINGGDFEVSRGVGLPQVATFENMTVDAEMRINDGSTAIIQGGLQLDANLFLDGGTLRMDGTSMLTGTGSVSCYAAPETNHVRAPSGTLTIGPGITIHSGSGTLTIGAPGETFVNQGALVADAGGHSLDLEGTGWSNEASIQATGGGLLNAMGVWTNGGTVFIDGSSQLLSADGVASGAGTPEFVIDGSFTTPSLSLLHSNAVLRGTGTVVGDVVNTSGEVSPGGAGVAGQLDISGNYTQQSGGITRVELGGTGPGQFDILAVTGMVDLNGLLEVLLVSGFTPSQGNIFEALTSTNLTGAFADVSASTLPTGLRVNHGLETLKLGALEPGAGVWVTSTVDTGTPSMGGAATTSSICAVDASTILIAYYNEDSKDVELAKSTDGGLSWTHQLVASVGGSGGGYVSMDCDDSGDCYVAYTDGSGANNELIVSVSDSLGDGDWDPRTVEEDSSFGSIDASNSKVFVSYILDGGSLQIAESNDGHDWDIESTGDSGATGFSSMVAISNSNKIIGYKGSDPYVATGSWTHDSIPGSGDRGDYMAVDSLDGVTIFAAYRDESDNDLEFARSTDGGSSWPIFRTVNDSGSSGLYTDLIAVTALDIFISTHGDGDLKLGRSSDGGLTWEEYIIDSTSLDVGEGTSIDALSADQVFISYFDEAAERVKFARSIPQ